MPIFAHRSPEKAYPVVLLTRFALRPDSELRIFPKATQSELWKRETWLESRLVALQRYTIPSLDAQTDANYLWFVGLDEQVPKVFVHKLGKALGRRAEIITVPATSTFNSMVTAELHRFAGPSITARLDSDDAVNRHFVSTLRLRCGNDQEVYNFPHGFGFFEEEGVVVRKWIRSNPFLSRLAEPSGHILTLGLHSAVGLNYRITEIPTVAPMYLKVYTNDMTSNFPQNGWATWGFPKRPLARHFGVTITDRAFARLHTRLRFSTSYIGRKSGSAVPIVKKIWMLLRRRNK